jgi:hypothetical protein
MGHRTSTGRGKVARKRAARQDDNDSDDTKQPNVGKVVKDVSLRVHTAMQSKENIVVFVMKWKCCDTDRQADKENTAGRAGRGNNNNCIRK